MMLCPEVFTHFYKSDLFFFKLNFDFFFFECAFVFFHFVWRKKEKLYMVSEKLDLVHGLENSLTEVGHNFINQYNV